MAVVLDVLLIALIALLGLIALILVTPFRVRIRGSRTSGLGEVSGYAGVPLGILGVGARLSETASHYTVYILGIPVWRRPLPFEKLVTRKTAPRTKTETPKPVDTDKPKGTSGRSTKLPRTISIGSSSSFRSSMPGGMGR